MGIDKATLDHLKKSRAVVGLVLVLSSGCSGLSEAGARVRLVNDSGALRGCERLGPIAGGSGWGGITSNVGHKRAMAGMRNEAADMGATDVLVVSSSAGWGGGHVEGEAYRCPEGHDIAAPAAGLAPAGCAKDTDCKSDRICAEGRCTDPRPR